MRVVSAVLAVLAVTMPSLASAQDCPQGRELYVDHDWRPGAGTKIITYFPEGEGSNVPLTFEGWAEDRMQWRVEGRHICSNGVVVCSGSVPLSNDEYVEAEATSISEAEGPVYLVLSSMKQWSYRAQVYADPAPSIVAEWFVEKPAAVEGEPLITLPSVYKVAGCQRP